MRKSHLRLQAKKRSQVPRAVTDRLQAAEKAYADAKQAANQRGAQGALAGSQSLLIDATQGRRTLQNRLVGLPPLSEGWAIQFDLQLETDTHFNFQLAKQIDQGLTGALVAFVDGQIVSYQPGTTTEFNAGKYDFASGQRRFQIRLDLKPDNDLALLTIESTSDDRIVLAEVPIAINGWNPAQNPGQGIFIDAQSGSRVVLDEIVIGDARDSEALTISFESPAYQTGSDVVGIEGWESAKFAKPPAASVVTASISDASITQLEQELAVARRAAQRPELGFRAAEVKLRSGRSRA